MTETGASHAHPAVTNADLIAAARRISPHAHRTPVLTSRALDRACGATLWFKCENFQRVGAFKFRGALNAVLSLDDAAAARGVATHSSGNFAQALALAARIRGIPAHVVMPANAPAVKREATAAYGAGIIPCHPTLEAREVGLAEVVARTGATFLHPYDDPRVIAGQGTAARELLAEVEGLDVVVTPVGGGGLLAGTSIATHAADPAIEVWAAEPVGAADAAASLAAGRIIPSRDPRTICDGLLTSLGAHTFPIIRVHVTVILTVDDAAVVRAMRLIWERMKIVVEPSAAIALAAILDRRDAVRGKRIGVILSGGNVDLDRLPW